MVLAEIVQRHRHRYEMNNRYIPVPEEAGLKISGYSPIQHLVETVEILATSLVYCGRSPPRIYRARHVMDIHCLPALSVRQNNSIKKPNKMALGIN